MTAIQPTNSTLRDKIDADSYTATLNEINVKYTEMDKFIGNLESDILSIKDFETEVLADEARGYDVGTSLDTLGFQKDSLEIDLEFFVHMKDVYIKKLYGDLYKYCDGIIENALAIEEIPASSTREIVKERKFRNMTPYPPPMVENPAAKDVNGEPVEGEPAEIADPYAKYDMNEIFALINCTTSNLRELAEDIGSFDDKISRATEREARGFSVGNLIMNLESQKTKLTLEFDSYIERLGKFLEQNKNFSERCLTRIQLISNEIVTTEEAAEASAETTDETTV
jgi:hypothetical protein|tara:strand:+ start:1738 stop:2586 length:849 start_codon:yes stop_codon:yes gene_type:complete